MPLPRDLINEILQNEESAYLLAGSPLCLKNLKDSGLLEDPQGIRLLCLGRTTCETARQMGLHPYAVAPDPDYERFIREFY